MKHFSLSQGELSVYCQIFCSEERFGCTYLYMQTKAQKIYTWFRFTKIIKTGYEVKILQFFF